MSAILMQLDVAAPADQVWSALATPEGIRGWWTNRAEVGDDGVTRLAFPDAPMTWDLRVEEAQEGRRLRWRCVGGPPPWIGTDLVFDLAAADGGTLLRFDHTGWQDEEEQVEDMVRVVTFGWGQILARLKQYGETGRPAPFFDF